MDYAGSAFHTMWRLTQFPPSFLIILLDRLKTNRLELHAIGGTTCSGLPGRGSGVTGSGTNHVGGAGSDERTSGSGTVGGESPNTAVSNEEVGASLQTVCQTGLVSITIGLRVDSLAGFFRRALAVAIYVGVDKPEVVSASDGCRRRSTSDVQGGGFVERRTEFSPPSHGGVHRRGLARDHNWRHDSAIEGLSNTAEPDFRCAPTNPRDRRRAAGDRLVGDR